MCILIRPNRTNSSIPLTHYLYRKINVLYLYEVNVIIFRPC